MVNHVNRAKLTQGMTHDKLNITVQKRIHRGEERLFIIMPYDLKRIEQIKKIPGRRYSQTHRQWHIPNNPESQQRIRALLSTNHSQQQKKNSITINEFWMSKVQSFEKYLAQQRYASTTIGHYKQALIQFLIWWNNRDISILNLKEIKEYNYQHFIKENRSYSAQNVWVNALKLFLEKESDIKININDIERPKKRKKLPDILSEEEVQKLIKSYKNLKHKTIIMMYIPFVLWYNTFISDRNFIKIKEEGTVLATAKASIYDDEINKLNPYKCSISQFKWYKHAACASLN